jgi:hypothetical protein
MVADSGGDAWVMSRLSTERYDDFTGGLNLRADQFQLARNESPDMLNVEIDPRGGVFSRGGMHKLNTTAVSGTWAPERLYPFYGDSSRLMLSNNTNVFWSSGGNFTKLEFSSGNAIVSASSHGACMYAWGDTLYITTGAATGKVGYKWKTGSTYATALSANGPTWQPYNNPIGNHLPRAEHVITHTNKLFVADTFEDGVRYPNRLRWSHEGLPGDWMEDDFIDFNGGGIGIRAMAIVAGQLVIFKPNGIYLLIGNSSDNFQVVELSTNLGTNNHHSMAQAENGVYFYSNPEGMFFYDGTKILDVFEPLRPLVDEGKLSTAATEPYSVSWIGRRAWLALPFDPNGIATKPTRNYVFDPSIGSRGAYTQFATHDGYGLIGGCDWTDDNGTNYRVACHPTQARVLKVDLYQEELDDIAGTPTIFGSYYRTGWVDGNTYAQKKVFRRPDIVFKQVDTQRIVNVKVYQNYEEASGNERKQFDVVLAGEGTGAYWGTDLWGTGLWGTSSEGVQVKPGRNLGLARSVQLLFTGPTNGGWGIDSITYKYNNRKVSG